LLSACTAAGPTNQAVLDKITDQCGLPRGTLKLEKSDIIFEPQSDAPYSAVDCTLKGIKKLPEVAQKLGFVGNERYEPEADNAQKN